MRQREQLLQEFKRWGYDERGWLPGTRDRYAREIRRADEWLRHNRNTTIILASLKDLRAYLFTRTPNERTRNRIRQTLVAFGDWKIDTGLEESNPAYSLPRLKERKRMMMPLTKSQAAAVLAAARTFDPMIHLLIALLCYSGMRKSEARCLQWSSVIIEQSSGWFQFTGKGRKDRVVPMHATLIPLFKRWREANHDPVWVFPSSKREGRPMGETWIRDMLWEVGDLAGVPKLHPHQLRRTFATEMLEVAPLEVVQELLGHEDPKTTRLYGQVRPPRLVDAMKTLDLEGASVESRSMFYSEGRDELRREAGSRAKTAGTGETGS